MALRISGLNSGLDTESIISELVKAKSEKKNSLVKAQTLVEWKQEAWQELNAKIYSFYSSTLSNMRLASDYVKKTTTASNSSAVSIVTGGDAVDGTQTMQVNSLATSGYLTGDEIETASGGQVSSSTKLTDIAGMENVAGSSIKVTVSGVEHEIEITEDMTVSELNAELDDLGLNASFDANNQRFFVSSASTGTAADFTMSGDGDVLKGLGFMDEDGEINKTVATDASITLNGAEFTSSANNFNINGLTITVNQVTSEAFSLTTANDTEAIYDMIKDFFTEYNALLKEIDTLYNADSASGYEPLTDEEKEAMTETEIEKWEETIKDAILKGDSTLSAVSSAIEGIMLGGVEMSDGTTLYLSDFGINTLGYFNAEENERSAYHIDGDSDDSAVSTNEDKLGAMIASDPDTVIEFFSTLARDLYQTLFDKMKSTEYSSVFKVYDDKLLQEEYDDYTDKIEAQEEKIAEYEDRWYSKFTAMEVALAKLQSKESALSSLFG